METLLRQHKTTKDQQEILTILIDSFSTMESTKRQLWELIISKLDSLDTWKEFKTEDPSIISDHAITILDELISGIDQIRERVRS